ncbi:uncharacterized protein LOC126838708 [Adelges cooleyi]|uniref:uncharacterized protein LOC126838708 n=1 Tax=Adelges cooleyi TaxID=133065 RepID=UPI00217FD170|nr:uncharacterized protein LOC126838708 [Adelges cooleyi]
MKHLCTLVLFALFACTALSDAVEFQDYNDASPESRTHKHKLKKLKKRLLLHCLLSHHRRRRDTAATGRFLLPLPIVLQSTNVNVNDGVTNGEGNYGNGEYHQGAGNGGYDPECMQMLNNHGPLLTGAISSAGSIAGLGDSGSRNGYAADWDRYARQFHRTFVRPLYRLF